MSENIGDGEEDEAWSGIRLHSDGEGSREYCDTCEDGHNDINDRDLQGKLADVGVFPEV